MSLRLRTPRSIVWLALCAFLSSTGLPLYESHGLGAADDAACLSAVAPNSTATLSALQPEDRPGHCAVCHLLRAVNGTIAPAIVALAIPAPLPASARPVSGTILAADHPVRSSRAPPSAV